MNRYITGGITRDLLDGLCVCLIAPRRSIARQQFDAVLNGLPSELVARSVTAAGSERLELTTGGRLFITTPTTQGLRGLSLDVLVVLNHRSVSLGELNEDVHLVLAPRDGELIRA